MDEKTRRVLIVEDDEPDIVLMDIEIQGELDGIQTAEELIAISNVPVVYLTGRSDDETLERAIKTAPYGYIIKPFEPEDLKIAIEIALNKHEIDEGREKLLSRLQGVVSKIMDKYNRPEKLGPNSKNWFK